MKPELNTKQTSLSPKPPPSPPNPPPTLSPRHLSGQSLPHHC